MRAPLPVPSTRSNPARWVSGDHPTAPGYAPDLESVPPGGHRTYQVPVSHPAPTLGTYTVRGEVAGAAFLAETTTYLWA
jgi:hypothetical protein